MRTNEPLVLAVDIGGTKTSVAAVEGMPDDGFRPLRPPSGFATVSDPHSFLDALLQSAAEAIPPGRRPVAVGIGVPGPLDPDRGVIETSPNIGWRDLPLARLVSERFGGIPTVIEDDANTGALGEAIAGAGRGADPFAYLPLGTGLGCGLVVRGRIVHGAHGSSGEIGHLAVDRRIGPRCSCGRRNCVEIWCAGAGLARRARERWPRAVLANGAHAPRDAASVFALAKTGDVTAVELVGQASHALAVGLAAIMAAVDPAVVSVGGTIGRSQPGFVRTAFREAQSLVMRSAGVGVRLRVPETRDASVLCGAAVLGVRAAVGS